MSAGFEPRVNVPLPSYLPPDTVQVIGWDEVMEALRSPHLRQEPPAVPSVHGGGLGFIDGASHRTRRRALNALVRPEALLRYRTEVVVPALRSVMEDVLVTGADGAARADLISMLQKVFIQFAAAFIGLRGADTTAGRDELQRVFRPLPFAHHVRFLTEGKEAAIEAALAAKGEYVETFVRPSLEEVRQGIAEAAAADRTGIVHESVLTLVAELADPAYANEDYAIADAIGLLIGAIDTSTHIVTHTVDDLMTWFSAHPQDVALREDLQFLNGAMEETLRLRTSPPVLGRVAVEDVHLSNGKVIRKGQRVAIYHSLANRDESVFGSNVGEFDPRREPVRNVARYGATFGAGSHMCIGQRVVVGDGHSPGSHVHVLRALFEAGVRRDPEAPPRRLDGEMAKFLSYPAIFDAWSPNPTS